MYENDDGFLGIILSGFAFLFIFRSYEITVALQNTAVDDVVDQFDSCYIDIRYSIILIYLCFLTFDILSPKLEQQTSSISCMLIGSSLYLLFTATNFLSNSYLKLLINAGIGIGFALLWCGHGVYLIRSCNKEDISRNAGIFWALIHIDPLGNGNNYVVPTKILTNILIAIGFSILSVLLILRVPKEKNKELLNRDHNYKIIDTIIEPKMILLTPLFIYTGRIEVSFFNVIQSNLSYFLNFNGLNIQELSKHSFLIANVLGGTLLATLPKTVNRLTIVSFGIIMHLLSYFLAYLNIPPSGHLNDLDKQSFLSINSYLPPCCTFSLGLGNTCLNTQVYSLIFSLFPETCSGAVAIYKLYQCTALFISMFYSLYYDLHFIIGICIFCLAIMYISYIYLEVISKHVTQNDVEGEIVNTSI